MNPLVRWPDTGLPSVILCAPGVLTDLERSATDGLLAMPRIGLGIGGLLLGRRSAGRVEIFRWKDIPCAHAHGPSFVLTDSEIAATLSVEVDVDEMEDFEVVGWYCSKTREPLDWTEQDRALFRTFCPHAGQVAMLIWPAKGRITKAAFGMRGTDAGAEIQMGDWMDMPRPELETAEPCAAFPVAMPLAIEDEPDLARRMLVDPHALPVAMPSSGTLLGERSDEMKPGTVSPWPERLLIAIIALLALAAVGYLTRGYWMPGHA